VSGEGMRGRGERVRGRQCTRGHREVLAMCLAQHAHVTLGDGSQPREVRRHGRVAEESEHGLV